MLERLAAGIFRLLGIGDARRSLAQLERMANSARRAGSEADLRAVVAAAYELGDALEGHDRSKALLIAFNARQALVELGHAHVPAVLEPAVERETDADAVRHGPEHGVVPERDGTPRPSRPVDPAGGNGRPGDLAATLKELATLYATGELSEDEFRRAKRKLLG